MCILIGGKTMFTAAGFAKALAYWKLFLQGVVCTVCLSFLTVLFGFLLARLAVGADIGSSETISGAALLLVAADAFWRASTLSQAESKMPERDSIPSVADALWLAETFGLTPRETEVAALLCENRSVPYICERLGLATSTTKTHASRIYEKAGVHSRDALQLLATSRGLKTERPDSPK